MLLVHGMLAKVEKSTSQGFHRSSGINAVYTEIFSQLKLTCTRIVVHVLHALEQVCEAFKECTAHYKCKRDQYNHIDKLASLTSVAAHISDIAFIVIILCSTATDALVHICAYVLNVH